MAEQTMCMEGRESSRLADPPSSSWVEWGQWIALASMMGDHIFVYLYPDAHLASWVSDTVGRIAFPLFASMMAWHVVHHTRSLRRYMWRVLALGCVAQVFYMSFTAYPVYAYLNVCFTLALGLILCGVLGAWGSLAGKRSVEFMSLNLQLALVVTGVLIASAFVEFGIMGALAVPAFVFFFRAGWGAGTRTYAAIISLVAVMGLLNFSPLAALVTLATTLVILLTAGQVNSKTHMRLHKGVWRAWYPVHFLVMRLFA